MRGCMVESIIDLIRRPGHARDAASPITFSNNTCAKREWGAVEPRGHATWRVRSFHRADPRLFVGIEKRHISQELIPQLLIQTPARGTIPRRCCRAARFYLPEAMIRTSVRQ